MFEFSAVDKAFGIFKQAIATLRIFITTTNSITSYPTPSPRRQRNLPLNQKTKDRLVVTGLLALEAFFIFGAVSNFYGYYFLKISIDIYLAMISMVGTTILLAFLIVIVISYREKRKILKSFQKQKKKL